MRGNVLKQFLKMYFKQPSKRELIKDPDSKIGIVSHGMFLRCLSAEGYDPEKQELIHPRHMKNCEVFPSKNLNQIF